MSENQKIEWALTAKDAASAVFRGVETSLDRVKGSYNQLLAVLGTGGVGGYLGSALKGAIDAGDQLNKMSQKIGISVESLSALQYGAGLADVGIEQLGTGLKKFNGALVEASDPTSKMAAVFKALGVDVRAGPKEALRQFATAVSQLADGELKTTLATQVLGKAGMELIPWLNAGRKGMDDSAESARKLGLVMSTQLAKQAEELNDNLKKLSTGTQALGLALANQMAGGLATVTGELVKAKEEGNYLLGVFRELGKLIAAGGSKLPGPIGAYYDAVAQRLFDETGGNGAMNGAQTGRIRRAGAADFVGPPAPDAAALLRALSGQKSVANTSIDDARRKGMAIIKQQEELEALRAESIKAEDARRLAAEQEDAEKRAAIEKGMFEDIEAQRERYFEKGRQLREIRQAQMKADAKEEDRIFTELGLTFSSAFGQLIIAGGTAGDVMRSLAQDVVQLIAKIVILEPLAENIRKIFKDMNKGGGAKSFFESLFGGGSSPSLQTSGGGITNIDFGGYGEGYAKGIDFVPRDGLYKLHRGEGVTPATQNSGGTVINITYNPTGAGGAADAQAMAATLIPMVRSIVRGEITNELRPGGSLQGA